MKIKDVSGKLIWATALIAMIRYMGSFIASDMGMITGWLSTVFTIFLAIAGMAMGFLDSIGTALLFNGWRKVMPHNGVKWNFKFKMLTLFVASLFISSLVILVPFTLSRIEQESIAIVLGGIGSPGEWVWGIMVNAIPFLLIGGVTLGNKWIEEMEDISYQKVSKLPENTPNLPNYKEHLPSDWRKVHPTLNQEQVYFLATSAPKVIVKELEKSGINITPRTAVNWRNNSRKELGMDNMTKEILQ